MTRAGSAILTVAGDEVTKRESGSWKSTGTHTAEAEVAAFAISPDGKQLAVVRDETSGEVTLSRTP